MSSFTNRMPNMNKKYETGGGSSSGVEVEMFPTLDSSV